MNTIAVPRRCLSRSFISDACELQCTLDYAHDGEHHYQVMTTIASTEPTTKTVLEEAARLTSKDRHHVYGHPLDNFMNTALLFTGILKAAGKLVEGTSITADEVQMLMIAVKLARLARSPTHRDTLIDIAGYARTLEMTQEKRAELYKQG